MIAPFDIPVLLTGETGTGKDLFAMQLHRLSPRGEKPFVALNCGGIAQAFWTANCSVMSKGRLPELSRTTRGVLNALTAEPFFLMK